VTRELSDRFAIASRTTEIDDARAWAARQLRTYGASDDLVWEVELALTEALSNVIHHAYGGAETERIELGLRLDGGRVELEILHSGRPFDPASYTAPDLDAAPAGGYGLHVISELMDEVEQTDAPGRGTRLRLVKRLVKEPQ
jgi:serine/threonine-protein kinase RsbW